MRIETTETNIRLVEFDDEKKDMVCKMGLQAETW